MITSHTLSVDIRDEKGFLRPDPIFPAGSLFGSTVLKNYSPSLQYSTEVKLKVRKGESQIVEKNDLLKDWKIPVNCLKNGVCHEIHGEISIVFTITHDGMLHLEVNSPNASFHRSFTLDRPVESYSADSLSKVN